MIDVRGFVGNQSDYGGLYKAADTVMRNKEFEQTNELRKEAKKSQAISQLNNFLDEKDYLTGSPYDPALVKKLHETLQEGYKLVEQGLSSADVFMALGPKVSQISEYSQKAKLINKNIKLATESRKAWGGYNTPQIEEGTRKSVFFNEDGTERDIRDIDPNKDYVSEYIDKNPYEATTDKGFDELFKSVKPEIKSGQQRVSRAGKVFDETYRTNLYAWQDLERDAKGNVELDAEGNPMIGIAGDTHTDASGKKYRALNKDYAKALLEKNPDIQTRVRGMVMNDFKQAASQSGAKIPDENSEEWDLHQRKVLADMLKQYGGGSASRVAKQDDGVRLYKPTEKKAEKTKGVFD